MSNTTLIPDSIDNLETQVVVPAEENLGIPNHVVAEVLHIPGASSDLIRLAISHINAKLLLGYFTLDAAGTHLTFRVAAFHVDSQDQPMGMSSQIKTILGQFVPMLHHLVQDHDPFGDLLAWEESTYASAETGIVLPGEILAAV